VSSTVVYVYMYELLVWIVCVLSAADASSVHLMLT
jgi:hypothetical protein